MPSEYERILGYGGKEQSVKAIVAALHTLFEVYVKNEEMKPGLLVRWKSRLKPQWGMKYHQPAIILRTPKGQNEICIGYIEPDGTASISWTDPNRLEPFKWEKS